MNRIFAFLTFGPIAAWALCAGAVIFMAEGIGCKVHEGFANPCKVLGVDIGETMYAMGVFAAWGPLLIAPYIVGFGLLWTAVALLRRLARSHRR